MQLEVLGHQPWSLGLQLEVLRHQGLHSLHTPSPQADLDFLAAMEVEV